MCPFTQSDGHLMPSTLTTYVSHFRYVVQYIAARDDRHLAAMPMATYLANWSAHYRRRAVAAESEKSWQVLDSKGKWIHW